MEKKTLLAFGLSFLILITWSLLFAPQEKQPDQVQRRAWGRKPIASAPTMPADPSPRPDLPSAKGRRSLSL